MLQFKKECEVIHNIFLKPFKTRKEGMKELDDNLNVWDAVILDAKMYDESEENESPRLDGLRNAIEHLHRISMKRDIPFFISTGQPDLLDDEVFKQSYGAFYVKGSDDVKLIADLKEQVDKSPRRQVQTYYYDAIEKLNSLNVRAGDTILDIFESMHYPGQHPNFNPLLYYNQLRQILEYVFRACNKVGIIPDDCFPPGEVNLSQCCHYISGNDAQRLGIRYGKPGDRIVPKHIQDMMFQILNLGNINSHTSKLNEDDKSRLEKYFNDNVYNSKYLIYGLAFHICEVVLWINRYISEHNDVEENKRKCVRIGNGATGQNNNIEKQDKGGVIEIIENSPSLCRIGSCYCISADYVRRKKLLGKKVKVLEQVDNTDPKTREQMPYYARKIELL